jgi:hypothetical protein
MPRFYVSECRVERKGWKGKGKHIIQAVETINLGFATDHNISGCKLLSLLAQNTMISSQVQFDGLKIPF